MQRMKVFRFDDKKGNRFYYFKKDGEVVVASGITSWIGRVSTEREAIERWKKMHPNWPELLNAASEYGTLMHLVFEKILLGQGVDLGLVAEMEVIALRYGKNPDMPTKDVLAFMKFLKDYNLKPIYLGDQCTEIMLPYQLQGEWMCMTIDLPCEIEFPEKKKIEVQEGEWKRGDKKGEPKMVEKTVIETTVMKCVIDFKSNFFEKDVKSYYEAHEFQLIGARRAVEQNFDMKIDKVFNWSPNNWRAEPSYTFDEKKVEQIDEELFDAHWQLARLKKMHMPSGRFLKANFEDGTFAWENYYEFAKRMLQ